jgi:hypothetical protein
MIDDQATLAVGAIALQPGNSSGGLSNVILVGTGEANSSGDSYYGLGILRSADAGNSWSLITSADSGTHPFKGLAFGKIAFSTSNTNLVVAATTATSVGLGDGLGSSIRGLYGSSNGGQTWALATVRDGATPISPAASTPSVVYNPAANLFFAAVRFHGIYSSSDGITWSRLSKQPAPAGVGLNSASTCPASNASNACPIYRGEFAVVPGRNEMYVWYVDAGEADQGIWRSTDGGSNWTQIDESGIASCGDASGGCGTQQGVYNLELAAVPHPAGSTATDLYAGAINIFKCTLNSTSNTTCSQGGGWLNLTHVYGCTPISSLAHVHPDQHDVAFAFPLPNNKAVMYFANDGGIYRALDGFSGLATEACSGTNQFDSLNTATLGSLTQFVSFSQHPTNSTIILGGTQDNGSPATNQATINSAWANVNNGDGGFNEINPANVNEWFTANFDVSIQRCTQGISCSANTFQLVVSNSTVGNDAGSFYTPYILDPQSASSELLVGTCRVWRGTGTGASFTALSNNFDTGTTATCTGPTVTNPGFFQVSALAAGGPTDVNGLSNVIYAGTDGQGPLALASPAGGQIFVTKNAAGGPATWSNVTHSINPNQFTVSSVAIDTSDSAGNTAYVALMGFGASHVFKTTNAGTSWTDFTGSGSGTLPDAPVNSIIVDPGGNPSTGTIYVGTDVGVFSSPTGAASWTEVGPGPAPGASGFIPNVPVTRLRIFSSGGQKVLRASTYGRGVWQYSLTTAPDYQISIANTPLTIFPSQTATFNGALTALNGYGSSVALSCTTASPPLPPTCTPNPSSLTPTADGAPFTIGVAGSIGDYVFDAHGVGADTGATTHDAPITLHVVDFNLTAPSPASVTANRPNASNSTTFQVTASGSFNQAVPLSCGGLPTGASCNFSPSNIVSPTSGNPVTVSLTIGTTASTSLGSFAITISASTTGAPSAKSQNLTLNVTGSPDYTLAISNPGQSALVTTSATFTGTVVSDGGYVTPVTLSCGTGAPATCTFSPSASIVPTAGGTPFSVTVSSQTSGNFAFNINGNGAGAGTPLQLVPVSFGSDPDFTLPATSGSATVRAGATATYTLNFAPAGSDSTFVNAVTYSCSTIGFPNLSSCSFVPAQVSAGTAASAGAVTLSIRTTAPVASLWPRRIFYAGLLSIPGLGLVFAGLRSNVSRRKMLVSGALGAVLCLTLLQAACGGGTSSGGPPPQPGTTPGTYTVTVNASEPSGLSTVVHSTTVTLTVQ